MSNATRKMHDNDGYFESLKDSTKEIVKDAILKAASERAGPEGYKTDDECLEDIECHSRDGFIAWSHNKGGLLYRNFSQLMDYWGGGYTPKHDRAAKEIERMIDYNFELVADQFKRDIGEELIAKYIPLDKISYCEIENARERLEKQGDLENAKVLEEWVNDIQNLENENLSDENSTVMHELRFMYHGIDDDGLHSASVSAAINTEAPYHRSSISWSRDTFCEGAKEVEITWKNNAELKRKLDKAFKQVSKAIF